MANPFGAAVDDDKLDQIVRYVDKQKTQEDRAREAVNLINEEEKKTKAHTYLDSVKEYYGSGVSTLCLIYNATGDTIYYVTDRDYSGFIGRTPYPPEIGNGQWAAFQHVQKTEDKSGSEAAVVYRGKNNYGDNRDFVIAWSTPYGALNQNKAYCDVGAEKSFEGQSCWDDLHDKVNKNGGYTNSIEKDGVKIEVDTARGSTPVFHAIIKIPLSP